MCVGLWINERTPRCQSQSGFDRSYGGWVFPWRRRKRRASFHRQYLQIYLSLFRSVGSVGSNPLCRRLSTHSRHRSRCSVRTHHHDQEGIYYLRVSYLRACRWSDWSCTCHHFRTSGCHHCVVKSTDWIGNLSSSRSTWFHFQNA